MIKMIMMTIMMVMMIMVVMVMMLMARIILVIFWYFFGSELARVAVSCIIPRFCDQYGQYTSVGRKPSATQIRSHLRNGGTVKSA